MTTTGRNLWNPPRVVSCVCGWTARAATLRVANDLYRLHAASASANQDHAPCYEEAP